MPEPAKKNLMKMTRNKHPLDVLKATLANGTTCMSETGLMRACYGPKVDTDRRGNGGRIAGIARTLAKSPDVIAFPASNGGTLYGLVRE